MQQCGRWPIGVCTWSLRMGIDAAIQAIGELGVGSVHLALGPALGEGGADYLARVQAQGWTISSAMIDFPQEDYSSLASIRRTGGIVPDNCWDSNRKRFFDAAGLAAEVGARYLSMHAGFLDESDPAPAATFRQRIRVLADAAAEEGITLLLETGQESAEGLRRFLEQMHHPALGVNFDPANMILYDKGNPAEGVRVLAPWIRHVHVKDAVRTATPGTWGAEVPWGDGQAGGEAFLAALEQAGYDGALAVEREAGNDRLGDIRLAIERLRRFSGRRG